MLQLANQNVVPELAIKRVVPQLVQQLGALRTASSVIEAERDRLRSETTDQRTAVTKLQAQLSTGIGCISRGRGVALETEKDLRVVIEKCKPENRRLTRLKTMWPARQLQISIAFGRTAHSILGKLQHFFFCVQHWKHQAIRQSSCGSCIRHTKPLFAPSCTASSRQHRLANPTFQS